MRLLALIGSLLLIVYFLVLIALTAINISRLVFTEKDGVRKSFMARQGLIFIWPLVMLSSEGAAAFDLIWNYEGEEK